MVIAAAVGVAEILIMSVFAFLGASGNSYSISNKNSNGLITSTLLTEGKEYICSELKIDKKESVNSGKIVSVNIPQNLQNEKIGKHLIINMESTCRANDCKEISGWATSNNIKFYQGLGYQTRNEIKESGAEIFKPLESDFSDTQQKAHNAFENISDATFINSKNFGKLHVNPLHVISPAEINEEKFWKQHDRDGMERYIDQIEKYEKCKELISKGGTLDEIRKSDFKLVIAYENFVSKGDTIRLQKNGDYYKIDGGGRHRVAAAQIYFLRTGKIVPIEAEVKEIV